MGWWLEPVAVRRRGLMIFAAIIGLACGGTIYYAHDSATKTAKKVVEGKKDRVRSRAEIARIARRVARVERGQLRARIIRELRACLLRGRCEQVLRRAARLRAARIRRARERHQRRAAGVPAPADHPGRSPGRPGRPGRGPSTPSTPSPAPNPSSPTPQPSQPPPSAPAPLVPIPELNVPPPGACLGGIRVGNCP